MTLAEKLEVFSHYLTFYDHDYIFLAYIKANSINVQRDLSCLKTNKEIFDYLKSAYLNYI